MNPTNRLFAAWLAIVAALSISDYGWGKGAAITAVWTAMAGLELLRQRRLG